MKPPLSMDGTTATHSAEASTSSGIPVSGADSISSITVPEAWIRSSALLLSFSSFLSSAANDRVDIATTRSNTRVFFIAISWFLNFEGPLESLLLAPWTFKIQEPRDGNEEDPRVASGGSDVYPGVCRRRQKR